MPMNASKQVSDKVASFFSHHAPITYKKGEVIIRAEDELFGVHYLAEGYVRQYLLSPSGEMFIVHIYKPGSFFPLTWVMNDTPNLYYFEAMTPVTLVRAPKEEFMRFLRQHSDVLWYATQRLAAGLSGFLHRVTQLVLDDAYTKTVLLILYYAEQFGESVEGGTLIRIPLTHREIAAWIGTTRETASLQVETLIRTGLLGTKGRLLIVRDAAKLRAAITS